jgi:tetratricopeptide (TPR) repeat protein
MDVVTDSSVEQNRLFGKQIAFTGRLASMTRHEAASLVRALGGEFSVQVTRDTSLVVVGQEGWPFKKDGRLSRKLELAKRLERRGTNIEIVPEEEFLEQAGLQELGASVCRHYTAAQLTRILGIKRERLRSWLRSGLVQPVETVHSVSYFDFRQVAQVKTLCELAQAGVTTARLRRSLEQLRSWMPDVEDSLERLRLLEDGRRLAIEAGNGRLAELHGQLLIDFEEPTPESFRLDDALTADDLFRQAIEHEDGGALDDAVKAYRECLQRFGPDPVVCFNLGNVLDRLGQSASAIERYRQAVELDPEYVEAWCNLGVCLGACGSVDEAVRACSRALAIDPTCADAHYNLADMLEQAGDIAEARRHWGAYLKYDSRSEWAAYARQRLAELSSA